MIDKGYEVVWPLGRSVYQELPSRLGLADLSGKTICEFWDWAFRGGEVFPIVRESLVKRYPGTKFVDYTVFGSVLPRARKESDILARLSDLLQKNGCDAVISGVGA